MADLPDDLNFGVNMADPSLEVGGNYNPPEPVKNIKTGSTDEQQQEPASDSKYDLKKAAHPVACISTFAFKGLAFFFYLVIGSIIDSTIITFILVILCSSLDFWVVKNITGRLLVGLRWWSQIDKNGKEAWRFQSPSEIRNANIVDNAFFWSSQIIGTAAWAVFLLLKVLTLSVFWSLLLLVCASLCGTNLYAYYQCRGEHQKKLGDLKKAGMKKIIESAF